LHTIRQACATFGISESCDRHPGRRADVDREIADWLVRLTTTYRTWGFGLCFLYLRNVKGFRGITNASIACIGRWNSICAFAHGSAWCGRRQRR
jgi:hypothetical protein